MPDSATASARSLARDLLTIGAVSLAPESPFTWASGRLAPIYCDNRLTLGYPRVRTAIRDAFAEAVARNGYAPDVIAGTATAGIPHAAWLADRLGLPMAYVRSKPKGHGRGNQIEGRIEPGQRVVLVEDLISTGGSSLEAVDALRRVGAEVAAVVAIFSYGLPAASEAFAGADVALHTLTTYPVLLEVATETGTIEFGSIEALRAWQKDPVAWSEARQQPAG